MHDLPFRRGLKLRTLMPRRVLFAVLSAALGAACAYHARATRSGPVSEVQLRELWDPSTFGRRQNLFEGPGGPRDTPPCRRILHLS